MCCFLNLCYNLYLCVFSGRITFLWWLLGECHWWFLWQIPCFTFFFYENWAIASSTTNSYKWFWYNFAIYQNYCFCLNILKLIFCIEMFTSSYQWRKLVYFPRNDMNWVKFTCEISVRGFSFEIHEFWWAPIPNIPLGRFDIQNYVCQSMCICYVLMRKSNMGSYNQPTDK